MEREHYSKQFDAELSDIREKLLEMGGKVEFMINDALKALGMSIAFDVRADFAEMTPPPAFISLVKHKTFLEVNEEGTEAAAATVVEMTRGGPPQTFRMTVDRPFFCAIRDNETGTLLFMGSIVDPQ